MSDNSESQADPPQNEAPPSEGEGTPAPVARDPIEINWEEKCNKLQQQLNALSEMTVLRKRLIEIRETESKELHSKLKDMNTVIAEEKKARTEMLKRLETAELECMTVKDKLKRNIESLDRMKGHHERRVTMLSANLEIAEIKAQANKRKLEEAHRKNAEQKGLLEELNLKLHENRKVTKNLEKKLKKSNDCNSFLNSQISNINALLARDDSFSSSGSMDVMLKIGRIVRQSIEASTEKDEKSSKPSDSKDDEDEGVELSSMIEVGLEDDDEPTSGPSSPPDGTENSCYKRVDTSTGPKFILSVSRTFIKLKDLILEKRSLQHKIDGLKTLNTKLESKVDKQEHRLYCVTKDLNKTWSLVSKLKMEQDKLHNNEAFLRYELKENRAVVEKLKKEMQSYKEKWRKVREKNDESQEVWQQLKDEFAERRRLREQRDSQSEESEESPPETPSPDEHENDKETTPSNDNEAAQATPKETDDNN